jgi:hypothetical protein
MEESSGLFLGMRKGARDLDMADRSEAVGEVVEYNKGVTVEESGDGHCRLILQRFRVAGDRLFLVEVECLVKARAPGRSSFPENIMTIATDKSSATQNLARIRRVEFMEQNYSKMCGGGWRILARYFEALFFGWICP